MFTVAWPEIWATLDVLEAVFIGWLNFIYLISGRIIAVGRLFSEGRGKL